MSKARNIADLGTNDVLETTSQGIDVTGAVTADGLTVDGDATLQSGAPTLTFIDTDGPYQSGIVQSGTHLFISNQSTGALRLRTNTNVERLQIASSGDISFYEDTGTTAKFFWDASAESLGIGTSSPRAQIDFAVPTLSSTLSRTNSDYQVMLEAPSGTGNYAHNIAWSESTGAAVAVAAINAVDEGSSSATGITFATGNSSSIAERMRIDSSGNVGIGTSSPALYASYRNLVLQGGSGGLYTSKDSTAAYDAAFGVDTSAGFVKCYAVSNHSLGFGTNNTERMRIDSSGNVGIGTSSPSKALHVVDSSADPLVVERSTTGNTAIQVTDGTDTVYFGMPTGGGFAVDDDANLSGAPWLRVDSSGTFLVGTAANVFSAKMNLYYSGSGTDTKGIAVRNTGSTGTKFMQFINSGGGEAGHILHSGSNTVQYNSGSDYRLKENVVDMTDAIDRVKELNVYRFNFIGEPDRVVDGFIAHEAQEVVPEAVSGTKDAMRIEEIYDEDGNVTGTREVPDYQGIDQSKLVPLLTAALQEAIGRIEALESKLTTLSE